MTGSETFSNSGDESSQPAPVDVAAAPASSKRKQLAALALALVVAVGVGYRQFARGPAEVSAATETPASIATLDVPVSYPPDSKEMLSDARRRSRQTQIIVEQLKDYPPVNHGPIPQVATNPFRSILPATPDADARQQEDQERAQATQSVQALQLQSVLLGEGVSSCLINNTLYRQGQQVDGFTIDRIGGSAIVVHRGVYRFEIRMLR